MLFPLLLSWPLLAQAPLTSGGEEPYVELFPEGGFFKYPIEVEIVCEGCVVFYTLDGTEPEPGRAQRYRESIPITKSSVLRIRALKGGRRAPDLAHTYFIGEPGSSFLTISLAIPPELLFHPSKGLFVNGPQVVDSVWSMPGANFWSRSEFPIHTEIFEKNGRCVFRSGMGFRLFGGMSRLFPQKSLALVARARFGEKRIHYPVFGKKGLNKFKFLVLRNSGSDFGKTHFRDAFMGSLLSDWDIDKQAYRPAHVYINGEYWGIYNIREKVNRYFVSAHHNIHRDSLDLIEHRLSRKRGSSIHYRKMLEFLEQNSLAESSNFAHLNTLMDIDNFMSYQIAQIYFDNRDAGGNIKFWRPQTPEGRWRWILYDTDWGFGLHDEKAYLFNSLAFHTEPDGPKWPNPPWSTFILRKLLENPEFKQQFINRFADHLNTSFHPDRVLARLDYFEQMLEPEIIRHMERWRIPESRYREHIERMRTFARQRPDFMRVHLREFFATGRSRRVEINVTEGGTVTLNQHLTLTPGLFTGQYFENVPIELAVRAEPGYRFVGWEGIDVRPGRGDLFFQLREDKRYQLRAVFEPYTHPLADLIMFNEVNCAGGAAGDWVEIYNHSDTKVNLEGWVFYDAKNKFELPAVVLPPKDYLILCQNAEAFAATYPEAYRFVGNFPFGLNKLKESLALYTHDGALVDKIDYEIPARDSSFTLNLLLPHLDNANPQNWEILSGLGTPNAANTYYVISSLKARREAWMQIGGASAVILLCVILLWFRRRGVI
jgi:hypothetical protein